MDIEEYRKRGKEMVDYIADYLENIRERRVFPNVKPGYMRNLVPDEAPLDGESWSKISEDIERVIMPGITHWQSPHMHAYFPALNSFPSLLGDMLADAINCLGFTWASSPACTELETIVMNWLGKMIGLPDEFLHLSKESKGGGVIQTTASESTLVCLLAGRTQGIKRYHERMPGLQDSEVNAKLVAYCSDQAHSSVEKAALIGLVRMRYIEADDNLSLRGEPLRQAILEDIQQGLVPFWVCATLGTTGACSFDNLREIGEVCQEFKLWLHVDAAYAGSAFICPEFRIWLEGIHMADSIAFNPSKWLMVHFDCTAMWVRNSAALHRTFNVEPLYLKHENSGLAIDYMHWQIPLSKRFRALKMWFVIRNYGIKGLQKHIREGVRLAQKLEALISADCRFEVPAARHLGMVVFRIRGENELTEKLLKRLNNRGNMHAVPASLKGKYVIRFTVTSTRTSNEDILKDWNEIRFVTTELLTELGVKVGERAKVSLKDTREKNEAFGSSLLLANSPMSPKIVNGSFAAIFDTDEFLAKAYAGIRISNQDSPAMRRRVRGILMSGKQFSLDSRMDLVVHNAKDINNGAITEDVEEACETSPSPDNAPKMTLPELVLIHDESESTVKKKCAISPLPMPGNIIPFFAIPSSSCTSLSSHEATAAVATRDVEQNNSKKYFTDNDENKYCPSSCLLPLAFDVVDGVCGSSSLKENNNSMLLSTINQSSTQQNFNNPFQLNVSPVPMHSGESPTRTLSNYNCSLDIILENQSIAAFNQKSSSNNQCYASQRKYSLDTAYLNRCSYYNKYFDCYTFNKYSDSIRERELSCRRFSAPTPIPSSSGMSSSSTSTTSTTTTKGRLGNTLFLGLSDPNINSYRLSMCNPVSSSIKEEPINLETIIPKVGIVKPKIKPRSKIVDLCFTPSIDKTDKLMSFQLNDPKICHKCGCASSKL